MRKLHSKGGKRSKDAETGPNKQAKRAKRGAAKRAISFREWEAILERPLTQAELDEIRVRENFRVALSGRRIEESSENLTFSLDKEDELS